MFLLLTIIVIITILFILTNNYENFFSGGTNIQLNSNDLSPTQTTLTQYRPLWLSTFYKQQPTTELEFAETVSNDFNNNFDVLGNNKGILNENFSCNKCKKNKDIVNENFSCGKWKNHNLYNINDYIVSNNYEQIKM